MTDDSLTGDKIPSKPESRVEPGCLILATIACMTVGSLFVAFFTIELGVQIREHRIWWKGHLDKRFLGSFLMELAGMLWVISALDFRRVRPVRAVIELTAGVVAVVLAVTLSVWYR